MTLYFNYNLNDPYIDLSSSSHSNRFFAPSFIMKEYLGCSKYFKYLCFYIRKMSGELSEWDNNGSLNYYYNIDAFSAGYKWQQAIYE